MLFHLLCHLWEAVLFRPLRSVLCQAVNQLLLSLAQIADTVLAIGVVTVLVFLSVILEHTHRLNHIRKALISPSELVSEIIYLIP